jgi:hypothetical protein
MRLPRSLLLAGELGRRFRLLTPRATTASTRLRRPEGTRLAGTRAVIRGGELGCGCCNLCSPHWVP